MESKSGLAVDVVLTQATGTAERDAALEHYDTNEFVGTCRAMGMTPHVAQRRWSRLDGRTTRHPAYRVSQKVRKRIKEIFGWVKTVGGGRKLRYQGVARNQLWMELTVAAYILVRMAKLLLPCQKLSPAT